jgi:hypothetical protein
MHSISMSMVFCHVVQFFVCDFYETSKTGWFFHLEFLKIPRIDDSQNQWFFEKSKNCVTHFVCFFVFGCVCVWRWQRTKKCSSTSCTLSIFNIFHAMHALIECLHEWAKFCQALSKNASWAAIVLVAKGCQISPLIWSVFL